MHRFLKTAMSQYLLSFSAQKIITPNLKEILKYLFGKVEIHSLEWLQTECFKLIKSGKFLKKLWCCIVGKRGGGW